MADNNSTLKINKEVEVTADAFKCQCGCNSLPANGLNSGLVLLVNYMNTVIGQKLNINSGYRCPNHNSEVGGAPESKHVLGEAADLHVPDGWSLKQMYDLAVKYGATGIGGYPESEFIHVDVGTDFRPYTWGSFPESGGTADATNRVQSAESGEALPTVSSPSPKTTPGGSSASSFGFSTSGNLTIKVNPKNKTYCEPIYPDLLSIPGNIPSSVVDAGEAIKTSSSATMGMDYVVTAQDNAKLSGLNISNFVNIDAIGERQKIYDPTKDKYIFKVPNVGSPLNCCDPYPVDNKIEELETHTPRVKQYSISLGEPNGNEVTLAKSILQAADYTEKRIVRLENLLSTVMRYTFGMGRRMQINCLYYGGQDSSRKYQCIRCKRDDMSGDGQVMQIDQCLSCTRYEPYYGQTYDILNEVASNTAAITDTNQTSHIDMQEYAKLNRIEQYQSELKDYKFDATKNKIRDSDDKPFDYNNQ